MNLTLTWDLFILVFFAIVITYSFIIGKKESVKIIVATYIGIVAVQGLGNVLGRFSTYVEMALSMVGLTYSPSVLSWTKLVLFIAIVILLAIRAGFDIVYNKEGNMVVNAIVTAVLGFASAGLLLSTLLTYVSNVPFLDSTLVSTASLSPVVQQSQLMQLMILNQDLWFALPALALVAVGFVSDTAKQ